MRRHLRTIATCGVLTCSFLATAQPFPVGGPGAWVPAPNVPMPNYFSSTNSRAIGHVRGEVGEVIMYAELCINGEPVETYTYDIQNADPRNVSLGAMFDSTHFGHGEEVEISILGIDSASNEFYETGSSTVINRLVAYGRYDIEIDGVTWNSPNYEFFSPAKATMPFVAGRFSGYGVAGDGANYHLEAYENDLMWTGTECLSDIFNATVFYVTSHGFANGFWTDENDYVYDRTLDSDGPPTLLERFVSGTGTPSSVRYPVLPVRQSANGSSSTYLPPYNDGEPPVNLAFIQACSTSGDNHLAEGFLWPYGNVYSGVSDFPENQALVGYGSKVYFYQLVDLVETFFITLIDNGATVFESRVVVEDLIDEAGFDDPNMIIWGDQAMKAKGVYTGNIHTVDATTWFRSI